MEMMSMKTFSKKLNDATFTDYYYRLKMLAKSVFKWENLPNGINEKWIEEFLFQHGKCVIYKDPNRGLMVAECNDDGALNNYREPTSVQPTGIEIEARTLDVGEDCVVIRNNDEMIATRYPIELFAYRLAEISRTIDVNVRAQKTPVLITCGEKQKLSLKTIYAQWSGNEPVIYGDKGFDPDAMKTLSTAAPIVFPELQVQKQTLWNECLTFLGINNANTEKRERLITDEVRANNDHIDLSAECFLKARQRAVDEINQLFGTEIKVSLRKEALEVCEQDTQYSLET